MFFDVLRATERTLPPALEVRPAIRGPRRIERPSTRERAAMKQPGLVFGHFVSVETADSRCPDSRATLAELKHAMTDAAIVSNQGLWPER